MNSLMRSPEDSWDVVAIALILDLSVFSLDFLFFLVYLVEWYIGDSFHSGLWRVRWLVLRLGYLRGTDLRTSFPLGHTSRCRGLGDFVAAKSGLERSRRS
jgi:hypothetical protein